MKEVNFYLSGLLQPTENSHCNNICSLAGTIIVEQNVVGFLGLQVTNHACFYIL